MEMAARQYYPEGVKQYKLTWVDPFNAQYLYSHMFDNVDDATNYANTLDPRFDALMFEYQGMNEQIYRWELLNFGKYKSYKYGMMISEFRFPFLIALLILFLIIKL